MIAFLVGSLAGRVAVVLCGFAILLPYLLRRDRLSRGFGRAQEHAPYLERLRPHFWTGYAILGLSTLHAGTVMGGMRRANGKGILAATVAFFLLLLEVVLGLSLRDQWLPSRRLYRRLHFWTMAGFVAMLGMHLWRNA